MGKGDIRTKRGKIWRGTYGVTRPRKWKNAPRPAPKSRKVKALKDIPKVVEQPIVKKPVEEKENKPVVAEVVAPPVVEKKEESFSPLPTTTKQPVQPKKKAQEASKDEPKTPEAQ